MFSLVQGFYEELTYLPERKVALLGVESAGKSSILEWLKVYLTKDARPNAVVPKPSSLDKMNPTVGLNVAKLRTAGEKLLVWDLGGAKALRSIWERYVEEAEAIIWVVDSADEGRLEDSRDALKKLVAREHLMHSPLLVFANKQDREDAFDPVKISLDLDLLSDAEKRPQCVQPCSADSGEFEARNANPMKLAVTVTATFQVLQAFGLDGYREGIQENVPPLDSAAWVKFHET